ncbi:hypothetical protein AB0N81_39550 [Streptomyces sp. NPDC093510]|uniref:hypothetical protein n=1 Tax=Streptomyces sp. NPDC093510 TaxID=3155199 RepID=UPI00341FBF38
MSVHALQREGECQPPFRLQEAELGGAVVGAGEGDVADVDGVIVGGLTGVGPGLGCGAASAVAGARRAPVLGSS